MKSLRTFVRRFWLPLVIVATVLIVGSAFLVGRYSVYQLHPELSDAERAQGVLIKVSKLIELPQGELPQMATIEDAASVKSAQPFLISAQNGDILIVYTQAQTALLYRPSLNKLIAVGPISSEEPAPVAKKAPVQEVKQKSETTNATSTEE